ncbi:MAG: hypothetical protein JNK05_07605 [Myxococcales bacterium]|nr:hypothetical protein [Myxococcales bacterium]
MKSTRCHLDLLGLLCLTPSCRSERRPEVQETPVGAQSPVQPTFVAP